VGKPLYGSVGGQNYLGKFIDHTESYGPHVIDKFTKGLSGIEMIVDIGAGLGRDLAIVKKNHPTSKTIALEANQLYASKLLGGVDHVHVLDIEKDMFPFSNESIDLFIANQVLEHTKEVFWIFDQVTRCLKVGGYFLFGVPNITSLHNRFITFLGGHPTQAKLCSAHVRPFSKADTIKFLDACFPKGYELDMFAGSQFYPLPAYLSRVACSLFPTMAFSIFFLIKKTHVYERQFLEYPLKAKFETNFYVGDLGANNQYY
jgi:SAM-dependent methyltransferase